MKQKHEILQTLKALDVYQQHEYEGKTAEEIEQFQQKINQVINQIIEEERQEVILEKTQCLQKEALALQEKFKHVQKEWEERKENIKKENINLFYLNLHMKKEMN